MLFLMAVQVGGTARKDRPSEDLKPSLQYSMIYEDTAVLKIRRSRRLQPAQAFDEQDDGDGDWTN